MAIERSVVSEWENKTKQNNNNTQQQQQQQLRVACNGKKQQQLRVACNSEIAMLTKSFTLFITELMNSGVTGGGKLEMK